jgi:hypothetical protein
MASAKALDTTRIAAITSAAFRMENNTVSPSVPSAPMVSAGISYALRFHDAENALADAHKTSLSFEEKAFDRVPIPILRGTAGERTRDLLVKAASPCTAAGECHLHQLEIPLSLLDPQSGLAEMDAADEEKELETAERYSMYHDNLKAAREAGYTTLQVKFDSDWRRAVKVIQTAHAAILKQRKQLHQAPDIHLRKIRISGPAIESGPIDNDAWKGHFKAIGVFAKAPWIDSEFLLHFDVGQVSATDTRRAIYAIFATAEVAEDVGTLFHEVSAMEVDVVRMRWLNPASRSNSRRKTRSTLDRYRRGPEHQPQMTQSQKIQSRAKPSQATSPQEQQPHETKQQKQRQKTTQQKQPSEKEQPRGQRNAKTSLPLSSTWGDPKPTEKNIVARRNAPQQQQQPQRPTLTQSTDNDLAFATITQQVQMLHVVQSETHKATQLMVQQLTEMMKLQQQMVVQFTALTRQITTIMSSLGAKMEPATTWEEHDNDSSCAGSMTSYSFPPDATTLKRTILSPPSTHSPNSPRDTSPPNKKAARAISSITDNDATMSSAGQHN